MDLSTVDILVGLGAIGLVAAAAVVLNSLRRPVTAPDSVAGVDVDGRHHLPPGLIDAPTTRLSPELLTKVQEPPPDLAREE